MRTNRLIIQWCVRAPILISVYSIYTSYCMRACISVYNTMYISKSHTPNICVRESERVSECVNECMRPFEPRHRHFCSLFLLLLLCIFNYFSYVNVNFFVCVFCCVPLPAVGYIFFGKVNKYRLQLWTPNSQPIFRALNTSAAIGFKTQMTSWWVGWFFQCGFLLASFVRLLVIHFIDSSQILWSNITSLLFFFFVWFLSSHRRKRKKKSETQINKQQTNGCRTMFNVVRYIYAPSTLKHTHTQYP